MPRALITGISGQDGLYLAELLLAKGYQVTGVLRGQRNPRRALVEELLPGAHLVDADILDLPALVRVVRDHDPDEVYNLAAVSYVAYSWTNPRLTTEVTAGGVLNLLEAVRLHGESTGRRIRFYQASSSEMFGKAQMVPQHEHTLLWPRSPYGVAKAFGHHLTITYRESYGMHASSGILFNHESPRRGPEFVTRKVSMAAAKIALGMQDRVALGNLDARRDWGFAGDYVDAMWRMLQQEEPDDYVVATGRTHSVRDLLTLAFDAAGLGDWEPYVYLDPALVRPAEVDLLVGDATKAQTQLGWKPVVSFEDLIPMMVEHDLTLLRAQHAGR